MTVAIAEPDGVIAAAELVAANPDRVSERRLQAALRRVRERKRREHGAWREAELAVLGALGARRRCREERAGA